MDRFESEPYESQAEIGDDWKYLDAKRECRYDRFDSEQPEPATIRCDGPCRRFFAEDELSQVHDAGMPLAQFLCSRCHDAHMEATTCPICNESLVGMPSTTMSQIEGSVHTRCYNAVMAEAVVAAQDYDDALCVMPVRKPVAVAMETQELLKTMAAMAKAEVA